MHYKYLTSILICSFTLVITVYSIIQPDKKVSDVENRALEPRPTVEYEQDNMSVIIDELLTGSYFKSWDNYFSDHIGGRNVFVNSYTQLQPMLNRKYINDVYFGEEGYLFSLGGYIAQKTESLKERATYFNNLTDEFPDSTLFLVSLPSKEMVYEDKVGIDAYRSPKTIDMDQFSSLISSDILQLDMLDYLSDGQEYYYKTDHHWMMNGTYLAYKKIIEELSKEFPQVGNPLEKSDFEITEYPEYFVGSEGRKVSQLVKQHETIEIWESPNQNAFNVSINDKEGQLINEEKLNLDALNNDYTVYMGGDNAKEVIVNEQVDNDLTVVLIGDSMSNPLVGLLANNINTIYSYDLRHYKESLVDEINQLNPDVIMMVGLTANFINPNSKIFNFN